MPKVKESKLMDLEPYGSIMNLLEICRQFHPEYDGLTHAHFLYALMEKPVMNGEKKDEMKKYFDQLKIPHKKVKKLEDFYERDKYLLLIWQLERGCIKGPQRLNEKLNTLIHIGWITSKGEPRYRRYYSSEKFQCFIKKTIINWFLDRLNNKRLAEIVNIVEAMDREERNKDFTEFLKKKK